MQVDIWGLCPTCDRWFRCERWFDRQAPQPTCDRCDSEPVAIENRAALARQRGPAIVGINVFGALRPGL